LVPYSVIPIPALEKIELGFSLSITFFISEQRLPELTADI